MMFFKWHQREMAKISQFILKLLFVVILMIFDMTVFMKVSLKAEFILFIKVGYMLSVMVMIKVLLSPFELLVGIKFKFIVRA